jgi:hypothetical protein
MAYHDRASQSDDSRRILYTQNNRNASLRQDLVRLPADQSHPLRVPPQGPADTRQSLPGTRPIPALGGQEMPTPIHDRLRTRSVPTQPVQQSMPWQPRGPSATSSPSARSRNYSTEVMQLQPMQSGVVGPAIVPTANPNLTQTRPHLPGSMQQQQAQQQQQQQQQQ